MRSPTTVRALSWVVCLLGLAPLHSRAQGTLQYRVAFEVDAALVETVAHAQSALHFYRDVFQAAEGDKMMAPDGRRLMHGDVAAAPVRPPR